MEFKDSLNHIYRFTDEMFKMAHDDPRTKRRLPTFSFVLAEHERMLFEQENPFKIADFDRINETFESLVNKMIKEYPSSISTACRRLTPLELARDILSVQPFPNNDNIIGSIVRQNKTPTD